MKLVDVNVLVGAFHSASTDHETARGIFNNLLQSDERFGVPEIVLQSVVRVVTQIKSEPDSTADVLDFCNAVREAANCELLQPGENHWEIFEKLCRDGDIRGKLVPDAYLAAFAIERSAIWLTFDADYKKFPGLIWQHLPGRQIFANPR